MRRLAVIVTALAVLVVGIVVWRIAAINSDGDKEEKPPPHTTGPRTSTGDDDYVGTDGEDFNQHGSLEDSNTDAFEPSPYRGLAQPPASEKDLKAAHAVVLDFCDLFATVRADDDLTARYEQLREISTEDTSQSITDAFGAQVPVAGSSRLFQVTSTWWKTVSPGQATLLVTGTATTVVDGQTSRTEIRYAVTALSSAGGQWHISAIAVDGQQ